MKGLYAECDRTLSGLSGNLAFPLCAACSAPSRSLSSSSWPWHVEGEEETLTLDCKIEGRKLADGEIELVLFSLRENGKRAGAMLLRQPAVRDPLWGKIIVPATTRAMRGDEVFFQLSCRKNPRISPMGNDLFYLNRLSSTPWDLLGVTSIREISEEQFLGILPKSGTP